MQPMLSLVALSGSEFVDALLRGGFRMKRKEGELIVLARGDKSVVVCETATLSADDLVYLLRRAGVAYFELLDLLAAGKNAPATLPPAHKSGFHRRYEQVAAVADGQTEAENPARSLADLVAEARAGRGR